MIYFLHGPDTYRSRKKLRELIDAYQKKSGGVLGCTRLDTEEDDLFEKLPPHSATLFQQKTLIVIENALAAKKDYTKFLEVRFPAWKDDANTIIIFWERLISEKRKKTAVLLEKNSAKTQEFSLPDGATLRRLITEEARERGISLGREATEALLSAGGDSWRMVRELEKYELIQLNAKRQTPNAKDELFGVQNSSFSVSSIKPYHLADAVIEGRRDALRAWHTLKNVAAVDDVLLLGVFVNAVRGMLLLKSAKDVGERARVANNEGMHTFVAKKLMIQAGRFSLVELKKIYQRLLTADILAKTGTLPAESVVMRIVETGLNFDIPLP
ncbi:MAG: hypothetical protein Q7R73_01320 [bacterium]|nr:hypothetical protein [bacterium]